MNKIYSLALDLEVSLFILFEIYSTFYYLCFILDAKCQITSFQRLRRKANI